MLIGVISILVALLEGLNIGLLVPLLETLQSADQEGGHWVTRTFAEVFNSLGLSLNLNTLLLAMGMLISLNAGLSYIKTILVVRTGIGFVIWMRSKLMQNYLSADLSYFHNEELGRMSNTLITQTDRAATSFNAVTEILTSCGVAGAYLLVAFVISPVLTAMALAIMLLVTVIMQIFITRARTMGDQVVRAYSELEAEAVENLSGIQVIKSFLLEGFRSMKFHSKAIDAGKVNFRVDMNRGLSYLVQELALFALIGVVVYVAVVAVGLDLAVIGALLFALYRMTPRVNVVNGLRQTLAVSMASLHHVKLSLDATAKSKIISGGRIFGGLQQAVELRDVNFSYNGGPDVLHHASFAIPKGKMTALVGTSGAGKSTLVDLILRYYDPDSGSLLVDGLDLRELELQSWRGSIGVVSQDIFLFNDTIADNIAIGKPGISMDEIVSAAKRAYAHDFIQKFPQGYYTLVGDRGWNLSGGQRQRIALARAILRKPEILILDEATSSLDSESENLVQNYIRDIRGTCTILVVAHRMSTIHDADKIAVLDEGKIVEEGDWESLLARNGIFANYHRLQFRT